MPVMSGFNKLKRRLREAYPELDVTIRRADCLRHDEWGNCEQRDDGTFIIRIERTLEDCLACLFLCHEWAHAVAFDAAQVHGKAWGVAFSRCYQIWHDEI